MSAPSPQDDGRIAVGPEPEPTADIAGRLGSLRAHLPKARRAAWNLVDQLLSAFTNTMMAILVARNVDAVAFGNFAVALLIFSLVIGVVRSVVVMPLTIRHSSDIGRDRITTMRSALGTSVALAVPVSVGLFAAWGLLGSDLGRTLAALGLVLPLLVIQDTCRFAFFAWARPQLATLNDLIWAIGQFGSTAILIVTDRATPWSLVLSWGFGAAIAAAVGCLQLRALPRVRLAPKWLADHHDLTRYLLSEYLVNQGAFQGGVLLIGGAMGVGNLGALRAAQTLVGPLGIISSASTAFGMPEVSRMPGLPRRTMLLATSISMTFFLVGMAFSALLLLIPDSLGSALFGDTWAGAASVLLPVVVAATLGGLKLGPIIFIYGRGLAKDAFPLVVTLAIGSIIFMVGGAYLGGVLGMAWGMAIAQLCVAPLWFRQLYIVTRPSALAASATGPKGPKGHDSSGSDEPASAAGSEL